MKVLIIDPWCGDGSNLYYYTTGLAAGISNSADVTVVTQCIFTSPRSAKFSVIKSFFPKSCGMKRGIARRLIRGIEYINTYLMAISLAEKERFDVIHIEWPLLYSVDKLLFKKLKKSCKLLVLKAHNVLPHSTGTEYLETFRKIYSVPDIVLLHGENLEKEFDTYFPEYSSKVRIQRHGIYLNHDIAYDENKIHENVREQINKAEKIYLFCGRIDYDKGADRLIRIWAESFANSKSILVVAGAVNESYDFSSSEGIISNCHNIVYLKGFVEDNLLNYLIDRSNIVVLPYRTGSMSGVAFTAAEFSKPLLSTDFGVISEYVQDGQNSYVVENTDEAIYKKIKQIEENVNKEELKQLGINLHEYFTDNYQWDVIGNKLVEEVYARN